MLKIGTRAPEFTLPDKDGNPVSLSDFVGKKVVLYFLIGFVFQLLSKRV